MKRPFGLRKAIWICRDQQYEEEELGRWGFIIKFWFAWLTKSICENCDGAGMTGYYEREACPNCEGYGLQIKGIYHEPCWKNFTEEDARKCLESDNKITEVSSD